MGPLLALIHGRFSPHARGCSHSERTRVQQNRCFPRMRGDVPASALLRSSDRVFSPHARGCSRTMRRGGLTLRVFPACAGMFPPQNTTQNPHKCFPRMRGDVAHDSGQSATPRGFSPHARGCSLAWAREAMIEAVFPAYAGMFRGKNVNFSRFPCFPRIRGDVPLGSSRPIPHFWFSPHTRGCSVGWKKNLWRTWVFPHTRGCSDLKDFRKSSRSVFPAYAGMFRLRGYYLPHQGCFPRIRGDVSMFERHGLELAVFSPHTRGCSSAAPRPRRRTTVFPAYAGIFL